MRTETDNDGTVAQGEMFRFRRGCAYPVTPGFKRAGTSQAAARAVASRAETLRGRCLEVLRAEALTADEVAARLGESILSVRPRISELSVGARIHDTGSRRANASGHRAIVWKAVVR